MRFFDSIYTRYDKLKEPYRFICFFSAVIICVSIAYSELPVISLFGWFMFFLFAITRVIYLSDDPFYSKTIGWKLSKWLEKKCGPRP